VTLPNGSRRAARGLVFVLGLFALGVWPCRAAVRYEVSLARPSSHLFHVTATFPEVQGELVLQMPAWNALYQIRDFSSRVQELTAEARGNPLPVEKRDKLTWVLHGEGTVALRYSVYWDSPGPFASQLNEEHAFLNPAMILLYSPARREEPLSLIFRDVPAGWRITTSLLAQAADAATRPVLEAPNYDRLVDSPVEVGRFSEFAVPGVAAAIRVAVHGDNWKQSEIESTLRRICNYELQLMQGAPFERYLFLLHAGKGASGSGGGMEHADSTAIAVPTGEQLAGVAAHEFFHLWNVKRIRPASLEPVDYTREQYTRALWFAEGVTSTYGNYALLRSGLWSKEAFYSDLSQRISELESRPANRWQSAEQSSLDAWLEKYPYYNGAEFSVSYYTKGQVLGVLLDILIRERTANAHSLDDVLRRMNLEFAQKGRHYRDSLDVRLTAESVAGGSLEEFFRAYVAEAEPLPYASVLAKAGLRLTKQQITRADPGFAVERDASGKSTVQSVVAGSSAERAGLKAGDEVAAWNGEVVPRRLDSWLRSARPGGVLRLQVLRNRQGVELSFALGEVAELVFAVDEDSHAPPAARTIRDGLLRGTPAAHAASR
jgi:predicted metalloprotease with PDZ domain